MPQISLIDQKGFHNKENLPETFKEVTNTSLKIHHPHFMQAAAVKQVEIKVIYKTSLNSWIPQVHIVSALQMVVLVKVTLKNIQHQFYQIC